MWEYCKESFSWKVIYLVVQICSKQSRLFLASSKIKITRIVAIVTHTPPCNSQKHKLIKKIQVETKWSLRSIIHSVPQWKTNKWSMQISWKNIRTIFYLEFLLFTASFSFLPNANARGGGTALPICLCLWMILPENL